MPRTSGSSPDRIRYLSSAHIVGAAITPILHYLPAKIGAQSEATGSRSGTPSSAFSSRPSSGCTH
ncbi:hypothetical protein RSAG8_05450, partial [Rhizoctonia solani AG-8 WAC10335]